MKVSTLVILLLLLVVPTVGLAQVISGVMHNWTITERNPNDERQYNVVVFEFHHDTSQHVILTQTGTCVHGTERQQASFTIPVEIDIPSKVIIVKEEGRAVSSDYGWDCTAQFPAGEYPYRIEDSQLVLTIHGGQEVRLDRVTK
jgi:hypothetical protein